MKILHISDLHLGKSIYGVSMIQSKDQEVWISRFLELSEDVKPDAVVIAGDIYDRSNPSGEAMELFDYMLTELNRMNIAVLMIAGNHDSGQRVGFAGSLLSKNKVYIAGVCEKEMTHVTLNGADGDEVTFWLMPYVFPAVVAKKLGSDEFKDYDSAVRAYLAAQNIDFTKKNVLVAHQNVTAFGKEMERAGSETMVGGVGQIDYTAFDGFDYVALGHIHGAYPVGRPQVRYAGSPLCYHFDEVKKSKKGPVLVTIGEKNGDYASVTTEIQEIKPLHPLRVIQGEYAVIQKEEEQNKTEGEYVSITLTDGRVTPEKAAYLRSLFESKGSLVMELLSSYQEQHAGSKMNLSVNDVVAKSMQDLFADFYSFRKNGQELSEDEMEALSFAQQLADKNIGRIDKDGKTSAMEADIDSLIAHIKKMEVNA